MPDFFIDLHIHTALSPCADNDMTPNNIVNMAILKGLDFIAITDHNSAENVNAVLECANDRIVVIPGIEVEVAEEFHVLCLFKNIENLLEASKLVRNSLKDIKNRKEIFGEQLIMDSNDDLVGEEVILLSTACSMGIKELTDIVKNNGGIIIPAHIDRQGYSILSTFGVIPEDLGFKTIEISKNTRIEGFINQLSNKYKNITSSDAHRLGDIFERVQKIQLREKTIDALFEYLDS